MKHSSVIVLGSHSELEGVLQSIKVCSVVGKDATRGGTEKGDKISHEQLNNTF